MNVSMDEAFEKYAAALGKRADELERAEIQQAIFSHIISITHPQAPLLGADFVRELALHQLEPDQYERIAAALSESLIDADFVRDIALTPENPGHVIYEVNQ